MVDGKPPADARAEHERTLEAIRLDATDEELRFWDRVLAHVISIPHSGLAAALTAADNALLWRRRRFGRR